MLLTLLCIWAFASCHVHGEVAVSSAFSDSKIPKPHTFREVALHFGTDKVSGNGRIGHNFDTMYTKYFEKMRLRWHVKKLLEIGAHSEIRTVSYAFSRPSLFCDRAGLHYVVWTWS